MLPVRRQVLLKSSTVRVAILPLLIAAPAAVYLSGEPWVTAAVFAFYIWLAVVFDSWIIAGTLIGTLIGTLADPPVKSGSIVYQAWRTAEHLLVGTAVGIAAGIAIEAGRRERARKDS